MMDVLGRSILTVNNISENMVLDISSFVTGTYTLKIGKHNNMVYKKIVIVK
jgi:hypothetical protein